MKRFTAWMMSGAIGLSMVPAAGAQSVSSSSSSSLLLSSSSVSSSGLTITPTTNSSSSLSSAPIYQPSSRSSSSSSLTRTQERLLRLQSSSSMNSSMSSRSTTRSSRSSSMSSAASVTNGRMIPQECANLTGRSLGQCVARLSPSYIDRTSSSSSSSSSSSMTGSGSLRTSQQVLRDLFRMTTGNGTNVDVMRQLCGMVMGDFLSTCATGPSNLKAFNMVLNMWFWSMSDALIDMMQDLNRDGTDVSDDYFWNGGDMWYGSGSWMSMSSSSSNSSN